MSVLFLILFEKRNTITKEQSVYNYNDYDDYYDDVFGTNILIFIIGLPIYPVLMKPGFVINETRFLPVELEIQCYPFLWSFRLLLSTEHVKLIAL